MCVSVLGQKITLGAGSCLPFSHGFLELNSGRPYQICALPKKNKTKKQHFCPWSISLAPYHYFLNIRLIWTSYISHKIPDFREALATLFVFNSLLKFLICRRKILKDEMSLLNVYHVSTKIGGLSGDADNKVFLAQSEMAQQVFTCRPAWQAGISLTGVISSGPT